MFENSNFIDIHEDDDDIVVWTRGEDKKLVCEKFPTKNYLYAFTRANGKAEGGYTDIYNAPLRKVNFDTKWDLRNFAKRYDDLCESDVAPAYKFILDEFVNSPKESPYNLIYYDIEYDFDLSDGRGYALPNNAFSPINSFQYFDANTQRYGIVYVCGKKFDYPKDPDGLPVEMIECKDEAELLLTVDELLNIYDVDVMAGWFTDGFDLPYLYARAIKLFGDAKGRSLFCRGGYKAKSRDFVNAFGDDATKWTIVGRIHLDMQDIYKKFIPTEKKSFSLSAVCTEDLDLDKVDYDGDLGELYRTNPTRFFDYAFWDVKLLKHLDKKHQIIDQAILYSRMNFVKPADVTGSVRPIEHGIMGFAHAMGIRLPDKTKNDKESFEGAIVYDTIAGRHGNGFTVDLSGLYPSIMIMLGLSPETMVMQLEGDYEDYVDVMAKSDRIVTVQVLDRGVVIEDIPMAAYEVEELIRETGSTISAAGIIFSGGLGLLAKYVQYGVALRTEYQKKMNEAYKSGNTDEGNAYNLRQRVVKLNNNSVYGCSGETSFRLFDLRLSRSITLSARVVSKFQAHRANELVEELAA